MRKYGAEMRCTHSFIHSTDKTEGTQVELAMAYELLFWILLTGQLPQG